MTFKFDNDFSERTKAQATKKKISKLNYTKNLTCVHQRNHQQMWTGREHFQVTHLVKG